MSPFRLNTVVARLAAIGLAAGLSVALPLHAQNSDKAKASEQKEGLSPDVFKALQGLQELIEAKKFPEATAKLNAADAVAKKSDYDQFIIERNRAAIASMQGDAAAAAKAVDYVIQTNRLSKEEQMRFMTGIAGMYYNAKDYANAIVWIQRYQAAGGKDTQIQMLLAQAYYLNNDFANAYKLLQTDLAALEKEGKIPTELQYQLLLNCTVKLNDRAAFYNVLEKLVTYYPTKDNWNDYLQRQRAKPGYPDTALLDFYRLKLALGLALEGDEMLDMAELSLRAGFPAEAKKVLDKGFQAGLLGTGKDAKVAKDMQAKANKGAAEDVKTMAAGEATAQKAKDGLPLVNLGLAYVTSGQLDKGIPLMEEGVKRGVAKRPTDAKLRLGYAYMQAGRKDDAKKVFESLAGEKDQTGELARDWIMFINKAPVEKT